MIRRRALLAASGASGGGGEWGEEITFYLDTLPFGDYYTLTARDGMTWADWVESEYNTIGVWFSEYEVYWNYFGICDYWTGILIKTTDKIISEKIYGVN